MGKNFPRKVVRQIPNRKFFHKIGETIKEEKLEENKESKTDTEMADERIVGTKAPKRRVKVEKKDKGLIERTDNSTILLTEDNKMVLTD